MIKTNDKKLKIPPVIGILGGGQLALMLCDAARSLNLPTRVFATQADDPAIGQADGFVVGSFKSQANLEDFFSTCDIIIYENEFIPSKVLIAAEQSTQAKLMPAAKVMAQCADKLEQKMIFSRLELPTSPFIHASPTADPQTFLDSALVRFPRGFVLKWAKGGYDGGGVLVCKGTVDRNRQIAFIEAAFKVDSSIYAEELVDFQTEVALVAVRSANGEFRAYPLVETIQEHNICTAVVGPAYPDFYQKATQRAEEIATSIDLVGVFAIEFFVQNQELLINELAPRVHNSGHVTMDGVETSQFANHLRAIVDLPLGALGHQAHYGMINILGPDGYIGPLDPPIMSPSQTTVHWYNKPQSRPGRKLGHINFWSDKVTSDEFTNIMSLCKRELAEWQQRQGKR